MWAPWRKAHTLLRETEVFKAAVREVVRECEECQSIDPAPVSWKAGRLDVCENWRRVGMDVYKWVLPFMIKMDLKVMVMKKYSTFQKLQDWSIRCSLMSYLRQ